MFPNSSAEHKSFHDSHHKKGDGGKGKGHKHYHNGYATGHKKEENEGYHTDSHHGKKKGGDYEHEKLHVNR